MIIILNLAFGGVGGFLVFMGTANGWLSVFATLITMLLSEISNRVGDGIEVNTKQMMLLADKLEQIEASVNSY